MPHDPQPREVEKRAVRARLRWARQWEIELPRRCPECASLRIAPIAFGLPGPELGEAAQRGELILGGCCCFGDERDPKWGCLDCGCRSYITGDQLIEFACERAGAALEQFAIELGPDRIGELKHLQPEFRKALREKVGDWVIDHEETLKPFPPGWRSLLGGADIIVQVASPVPHRYLCELKWCGDIKTLGWTLQDIYKMVAATQIEGVRGCYVVAGAPEGFWESEEHCAPLFTTGTWRSLDLFQRFQEDWKALLGETTARLDFVPASIETRIVADIPVMMESKRWCLRAIAVSPAELLLFDGDWPIGIGAVQAGE